MVRYVSPIGSFIQGRRQAEEDNWRDIFNVQKQEQQEQALQYDRETLPSKIGESKAGATYRIGRFGRLGETEAAAHPGMLAETRGLSDISEETWRRLREQGYPGLEGASQARGRMLDTQAREAYYGGVRPEEVGANLARQRMAESGLTAGASEFAQKIQPIQQGIIEGGLIGQQRRMPTDQELMDLQATGRLDEAYNAIQLGMTPYMEIVKSQGGQVSDQQLRDIRAAAGRSAGPLYTMGADGQLLFRNRPALQSFADAENAAVRAARISPASATAMARAMEAKNPGSGIAFLEEWRQSGGFGIGAGAGVTNPMMGAPQTTPTGQLAAPAKATPATPVSQGAQKAVTAPQTYPSDVPLPPTPQAQGYPRFDPRNYEMGVLTPEQQANAAKVYNELRNIMWRLFGV